MIANQCFCLVSIGFAIAERLAKEGAAVVISSRKQKNVDDAVTALTSQGLRAAGCTCHVADAQQRRDLFQTVECFKRYLTLAFHIFASLFSFSGCRQVWRHRYFSLECRHQSCVHIFHRGTFNHNCVR